MIRNKLLYAVLLAVLILFYYLYRGDPERGDLSLALLVFAAILPVILFAGLLRLKHAVKVRLCHSKEPILKGQIYQWVLQITNKSILSCAEARVSLEYSNSLTGESEPLTLAVPVLAHNSQRVRLSFHTVTCGVMDMQLHYLDLYDPLRIFRQRIRLNTEDQVLVMPSQTIPVPEEWPPVPQPEADTSEFSKVKAGDDPSEIFDLHTYREGDSIARIHWKLSSKLDQLMVKEFSLPLSAGCLLVTDPVISGEMPEAALRLDTAYSALFSVIAQLTEQDMSFALASWQQQDGLQISDLYETLSEAAPWLRHMIAMPPVPETERSALLTAIETELPQTQQFERILVFTPCLDTALTELLSSIPRPERLTVFAVADSESDEAENGLPFRCIFVAQQEPVHPAMIPLRAEDEPDFDTEVLVEGGAAS